MLRNRRAARYRLAVKGRGLSLPSYRPLARMPTQEFAAFRRDRSDATFARWSCLTTHVGDPLRKMQRKNPETGTCIDHHENEHGNLGQQRLTARLKDPERYQMRHTNTHEMTDQN